VRSRENINFVPSCGAGLGCRGPGSRGRRRPPPLCGLPAGRPPRRTASSSPATRARVVASTFASENCSGGAATAVLPRSIAAAPLPAGVLFQTPPPDLPRCRCASAPPASPPPHPTLPARASLFLSASLRGGGAAARCLVGRRSLGPPLGARSARPARSPEGSPTRRSRREREERESRSPAPAPWRAHFPFLSVGLSFVCCFLVQRSSCSPWLSW
jgi:hypothetical protein